MSLIIFCSASTTGKQRQRPTLPAAARSTLTNLWIYCICRYIMMHRRVGSVMHSMISNRRGSKSAGELSSKPVLVQTRPPMPVIIKHEQYT
eukprot:1109972-Pleurochrysis_carterae.AAC.3